jgi:hypothetical protein
MVSPVTLTLTEAQHAELHQHLFPGDGLEAVAFLVCGRRNGARHRLYVRKVAPVPYERCSVRAPDRVTWPTDVLPPLLAEAERRGDAIVKIHGHSGFDRFSDVDDQSDRALFPSLYCWLDSESPHGSAILLDDGRVFGRVCRPDGGFEPFETVAVIGDDLKFYRNTDAGEAVPEHARRVAQTFGKGTFAALRGLKVGVVGCSGTGSPTIEMLARNCVGKLVLVDPDVVEPKNLNRIFNSRLADAEARRPKVEVLAVAIEGMGLGTDVQIFGRDLFDRDVVFALADCDVLFGCMDTVDGRHLLSRLAAYYSLPYFDLGVKLEADGHGGVDQVAGSVHYLKPGGSSLLSRHVYSAEQVRAAGLARTDPGAYRRQVKEGYIRGVAEDRPAVIHVNTLVASLAVNELLARLHPFRLDSNREFAVRRVSLSHDIFAREPDGEPCQALARHVGRGDVEPLLDWPELSLRSHAA